MEFSVWQLIHIASGPALGTLRRSRKVPFCTFRTFGPPQAPRRRRRSEKGGTHQNQGAMEIFDFGPFFSPSSFLPFPLVLSRKHCSRQLPLQAVLLFSDRGQSRNVCNRSLNLSRGGFLCPTSNEEDARGNNKKEWTRRRDGPGPEHFYSIVQ